MGLFYSRNKFIKVSPSATGCKQDFSRWSKVSRKFMLSVAVLTLAITSLLQILPQTQNARAVDNVGDYLFDGQTATSLSLGSNSQLRIDSVGNIYVMKLDQNYANDTNGNNFVTVTVEKYSPWPNPELLKTTTLNVQYTTITTDSNNDVVTTVINAYPNYGGAAAWTVDDIGNIYMETGGDGTTTTTIVDSDGNQLSSDSKTYMVVKFAPDGGNPTAFLGLMKETSSKVDGCSGALDLLGDGGITTCNTIYTSQEYYKIDRESNGSMVFYNGQIWDFPGYSVQHLATDGTADQCGLGAVLNPVANSEPSLLGTISCSGGDMQIHVVDAVVAPDGSIILSGHFYNYNNGQSYNLALITPDGVLTPITLSNLPGSADSSLCGGTSVATDRAGNIYVSCSIWDEAAQTTLTLLKFDANGNYLTTIATLSGGDNSDFYTNYSGGNIAVSADGQYVFGALPSYLATDSSTVLFNVYRQLIACEFNDQILSDDSRCLAPFAPNTGIDR